jgi:hypothetical protein
MPPSLNFPQLDFVEPSNGFHLVTWERVIQCVYCGGEWSSKLRLSDHRSKGWDALKDLITNNPIFILVLPNLAYA